MFLKDLLEKEKEVKELELIRYKVKSDYKDFTFSLVNNNDTYLKDRIKSDRISLESVYESNDLSVTSKTLFIDDLFLDLLDIKDILINLKEKEVTIFSDLAKPIKDLSVTKKELDKKNEKLLLGITDKDIPIKIEKDYNSEASIKSYRELLELEKLNRESFNDYNDFTKGYNNDKNKNSYKPITEIDDLNDNELITITIRSNKNKSIISYVKSLAKNYNSYRILSELGINTYRIVSENLIPNGIDNTTEIIITINL